MASDCSLLLADRHPSIHHHLLKEFRMMQQLMVFRFANGTKNAVCRILFSFLVLGTLIATCYHILMLQQRSLSSNQIITHDIVLQSSSTTDMRKSHSMEVSLIKNASVTQHQRTASTNQTMTQFPTGSVPPTLHIANAKTDTKTNQTETLAPSNASCIPPFSSSNSKNYLPKRHIFVDFGANDAHSVELFLNSSTIYWNEIDSYSKRVANLRRSNISGAMLGWEVHVFEANPNPELLLKQEAQRLHMVSNNLTKSYHLYNSTAITTHDGFIEFILDNNKTGSSGSTTMNESASAVGRKVNVTAVDIVTFLKSLQIREMDEVVIKMDVEGAEYELCRRMIAYCLFPLIDRIAIEWHHHNQFVFLLHENKYHKEYQSILQALVERGWRHKLLEWA